MCLKDLTYVHSGRYAEWVKNHIYRRSIGEVRHILLRKNSGEDSLVSVTTRHLITYLDLTLGSDEHLNHLDDSRRKLITLLETLDLLVEVRALVVDQLTGTNNHLVDLALNRLVSDLDISEVLERYGVKQLSRELRVLGDKLITLVVYQTSCRGLAIEKLNDLPHRGVTKDVDLVTLILLKERDLSLLKLDCALVLISALAGEYLSGDDSSLNSRWEFQAAITNLSCLLSEDSSEELLFWAELGLALWSDLTNDDIAWLNLSSDTDDSGLVEVLKSLFTNVRNISSNLFLSELGITSDTLELLDVNGCEHILLYEVFADQYGVLEVVAVPWHERDHTVLTERELRHICRWSVSDNFVSADLLTNAHNRTLGDTGVLVRTPVLNKLVDIYARVERVIPSLVSLDNDTLRLNGHYSSGALSHDRRPGVTSNDVLHSGSDERSLCSQARYSLTLHVRSHQRAVSVVVLKERNEGCGN